MSTRPSGVTFLCVVNGSAALLTLLFWMMVLKRLYFPDAPDSGLDRGSMGSTLGFLVADLAWALPGLVATAVGLWRMRAWGWLMAQMMNALWIYSLTAVWVRDLYLHAITPGGILFLPFVPFSIWAIFYLWMKKSDYFTTQKSAA